MSTHLSILFATPTRGTCGAGCCLAGAGNCNSFVSRSIGGLTIIISSHNIVAASKVNTYCVSFLAFVCLTF
jgi:hypothetical protein